MQTRFSLAQLADPATAESNKILRACVHCGFCTATCPTYVLLGDELDCPRGRIYLIKDMLEQGRPATAEVVKHVDRCLSCLACMTTCPSGVHYMHLVDHARGSYREHLSAAAGGTEWCEHCWRLCCLIRRGCVPRWPLAPLARPFAGAAVCDRLAAACRHAAARPGARFAGTVRRAEASRSSGRRHAQGPRGVASGLRKPGARRRRSTRPRSVS